MALLLHHHGQALTGDLDFHRQGRAHDALKGAVPMSGVYWIPTLEEDTPAMFKMFPKAFGTDKEACRDASPIHHLKGASVPMLAITESDCAPIRAQMKMFKAAVDKEGLGNIRFEDAADRTHLTIVTKMARKGEDPVRDLVIGFIRKRCEELDGKK